MLSRGTARYCFSTTVCVSGNKVYILMEFDLGFCLAVF